MIDRVARLHLERSARREDGLSRQIVRRTGPRAEQPGVGDRTQRRAARRPVWRTPSGRRARSVQPRLTEAQLAAVHAVRETCLATRGHGVRSPIEQAEREEAIADWLADHGLDVAIAEMACRHRRDVRGARPPGRRGRWAGVERRAAMGGGRVFGPRPRLGDSGRRDAHLRPGHGDQGLHAHGPGERSPSRWT